MDKLFSTDLSASQIVAKALELRGFILFPTEEGWWISSGNRNYELGMIREMLEEFNVSFTLKERLLLIQSEVAKEDVVKSIVWYPARNSESWEGSGWRTWKYFVQRKHGPKLSTINLESGVAFLIKSLSYAGITTVMSCDGHGKRSPKIFFAGPHNAAWFELLFQQFIHDHSYNYTWNVDEGKYNEIFLGAESSTGWDLQKVLEDTYHMGQWFYQNAEVVSNWKRQLFGMSINSTKRAVKQMNREALSHWMKEKMLQNMRFDKKHETNT